MKVGYMKTFSKQDAIDSEINTRRKAHKELFILVDWIQAHIDEIKPFLPNREIGAKHEWSGIIINNIISSISGGDKKAIQIACQLLVDDQK